MIQQLTLSEFLTAAKNTPVVDVRTPAEFEQGHIIGACNIPIFSNEERVKVGTTYTQVGKQAAILLGFELTGPKWADFIREAERIAPDKKILVHCWRGGMRSGAMAWALDLYGFTVATLRNGYKAYRRAGIEALARDYPFVVLSGYTGTGKTGVLQELLRSGEQAIDLEELAQHRGSAFGSLGKMKQPSQEQFENLLAAELEKMDPGKRIWIEDESVTIGKRAIPKNIFAQLIKAPLIRLDIPLQERLGFLTEEYGSLDKDFLKESVGRISRRLGSLRVRLAIDAIEEGRMADFIAHVLIYYDKAYRHCLDNRQPSTIHPLALGRIDPVRNARALLNFCHQQNIVPQQSIAPRQNIVHSQNITHQPNSIPPQNIVHGSD
ncbi:MAG TPA: tRNA 2-selenouridine(34) synthase MnmH [Puia sp.]|nr:tRNA 2-selenouridine(34) synthase MnmH [Puia sp.]